MLEKKKNIAVIWGGYSSEAPVSEKSMMGICSNLDITKYNVYSAKITKDAWTVDVDGHIVGIDKNDFSFLRGSERIKIDFAYITIHGTPGEDGKLQGYFDMINLPYSSSGMMASALTLNKFVCNRYLKSYGVNVADSYYIRFGDKYNMDEIVANLQLPLFVKPNVGGSSCATTKVKKADDLANAISLAFEEANEVIIERFIEGREVTCGCYKIANKEVVFPITEVLTQNDFFDYNAKYKGEVVEITPADLSEKLTETIQKETLRIYDLVGAKGIVRADYIISNGVPYFLELNTTPGMTPTSFIPQQVKSGGLDLSAVFTEIIENEYNK